MYLLFSRQAVLKPVEVLPRSAGSPGQTEDFSGSVQKNIFILMMCMLIICLGVEDNGTL
jgi:hypothetical protein